MKAHNELALAGVAAIGVALVFGFYLWQGGFGDGGGAGSGAMTGPDGQLDLASVRVPVASGAALEEGKRLYADACASCHGAQLQGAPNWKEPLADGTYPAPPHDQSGHTWHHPDGFLFAYTKLGGQPFMPDGRTSAMPGFGDRYSDEEILAILGYIKSRWPSDVRAKQARITQQASDG